MNFKLDEKELEVLNEISAISGYSKLQVSEIWEFTYLYILEKFLENISDGKMNDTKVQIPLIGTLKSKYLGENVNDNIRVSEYKNELEFSNLFRRSLEDAIDGDIDLVDDILNKKLKESIMHCLNEN